MAQLQVANAIHTEPIQVPERLSPPRCTHGYNVAVLPVYSRHFYSDFTHLLVLGCSRLALCAMAPSSDHIYIETAINLPGSPSAITLGVHLVPVPGDAHHRQQFNGYRLDVHGNKWPADRHNELLTIAKRQAVALSEKLRDAGFDFTDAHLCVHIPSM